VRQVCLNSVSVGDFKFDSLGLRFGLSLSSSAFCCLIGGPGLTDYSQAFLRISGFVFYHYYCIILDYWLPYFATRCLLALLTDVPGGRIKVTGTRLIVGLITPHRTYLTIMKPVREVKARFRAVVPLMMMMALEILLPVESNVKLHQASVFKIALITAYCVPRISADYVLI
jgi:hypothetical protein